MNLFKNIILFILIFTFSVVAQNNNTKAKQVKPVVTFIELGSVNCIPCKKMQSVMEAVEKKYGSQLKVIFYDVWQKDQKIYAQKYNVKLIPTQVFLDEDGKEFHRHEGYYPEKEIDKILTGKGLKVLQELKK